MVSSNYSFLLKPLKGLIKTVKNRKRIAKLENTQSNQVVYFYYDNLDNQHTVCEAERHFVNAKIRRDTIPPLSNRGAVLETISFENNRRAGEDISARTLTVYERGTLGEGSKGNKWYENQQNIIPLVNSDILQEEGVGSQTFRALNYTSGNLTINFGYEDTRRRYASPNLFAAFLGALAQLNLNQATRNAYVTSEGFAYSDGSCYPSSMHRNGESVDTHYFSQKGQAEAFQQPFINALHDYGFDTHYIGCNMRYRHGTSDCGQFGGIHDNHLHSSSINENIIHSIIPE